MTLPRTTAPSTAAAPARRLWLDLARSLALLAMAIFHLTFDLELAGFLAPGTTVTPFWGGFARAIAGSFLMLAGVSLWLSQGRRMAAGRGPSLGAALRRAARLGLAAAAVSLVTWFALPGAFVHFGILHVMALAGLLALPALWLAWPAVLGLAALAFAAPGLWMGALSGPFWWWTGLAADFPPSVDYLPILPWIAPLLLGLALAKAADAAGWSRPARGQVVPAARRATRVQPWLARLAWPGRHSLAIYLIHQPVLLALVLGAAWLLRG